MFNLSWEVHGSVSFSLSVSDLHIGEFVRCSVGRKKTPYELSHSFIESMIVCAAYKQVQYKKKSTEKKYISIESMTIRSIPQVIVSMIHPCRILSNQRHRLNTSEIVIVADRKP